MNDFVPPPFTVPFASERRRPHPDARHECFPLWVYEDREQPLVVELDRPVQRLPAGYRGIVRENEWVGVRGRTKRSSPEDRRGCA